MMVSGAQDQQKQTLLIASSNKKNKMNSESDSENEAVEFPRFIVLESLEETCLPKLSPFLISHRVALEQSKRQETAICLWR